MLSLLTAITLPLAAGDGTIRRFARKVPNRYIVVLDDAKISDEVEIILDDIITAHNVKKVDLYKHAIKGFTIEATDKQAQRISADPRVLFIEENSEVELASAARGWNTDRVDNHLTPRLDGLINDTGSGRNVRAYVVDTGIWAGHDEFSNPNPLTGGPRVVVGWDYMNWKYPNDSNWPNRSTNPCPELTAGDFGSSHGTAVASILGGRTMGVAPEVTLVPVRFPATKCDYRGDAGQVIAGLEWILTDPGYVAGQGRVVNMSLVNAGDGAIDGAVNTLLGAGITVVAAAGNQNQPIAMNFSPARVPGIITVGGSKGRYAGDLDSRWNDGPTTDNAGSNYGAVIDLFAPADHVIAAHWSSPTAIRDPENTVTSSGTSFASPLVAGAAARLLEFYPAETCDQIANRLISAATTDIHGLDLLDRRDSPNRLLFISTVRRRPCC